MLWDLLMKLIENYVWRDGWLMGLMVSSKRVMECWLMQKGFPKYIQ